MTAVLRGTTVLARTVARLVAAGQDLADATRSAREMGEPMPWRAVAWFVRHDLERIVGDPLRWSLLRALPDRVVYWVLLRAVADGTRDDEVVTAVPAMELVARFGSGAERTAAEQRPSLRADDVRLSAHDAAWLRVLVDNAIPDQPGGPMDWEGRGRAYALEMLGVPGVVTVFDRFSEQPRPAGESLRARVAAAVGSATARPAAAVVGHDDDGDPILAVDPTRPGGA